MNNEEKPKIINTIQEEKSKILTKRLKEEIAKLGYTQKEVAHKVGVSPSAINKYFKGNGFPDTITLEALAKLFGVSSNYLIGKADCPTYTFEDISEKTGLSQKSIEKLYQLQHDYLLFEDEDNIKIDIQEKRKISKQYKEHLNILNSMIESDVYLFWLLDSIRKYKVKSEELNNTKDFTKKLAINEELETLEEKIKARFSILLKDITKRGEN